MIYLPSSKSQIFKNHSSSLALKKDTAEQDLLKRTKNENSELKFPL